MMMNKPKVGIFDEKYNMAMGQTYYKEIQGLIRRYYTMVSDAAIDAYIHSGDFAQLTATELLARSGLDLHSLYPKIDNTATKFVDKIEMQSNAAFRRAYVQAQKPIPSQLQHPRRSQKQHNLISQQVQKITNLLDHQKTKIDEALQNAIVEKRSLSYFKQQLRDAGIYNEKRIKIIAFNQLHYATNITNINKSLELGLQHGVWRHPPKSVYKTEPRKSHEEANGKVFDLERGCKIDGEYIFPAQLPNCFPGTTKIQFAQGIKTTFRRWGTYKLVKLITKSGNVIESTSNHPILTQRGFINANIINVGDYTVKIIGVKSLSSNNNSNDHISTGIDFSDAFDTAATHSDTHAGIIRNADFHGEKIVDQDINIVNINGGLTANIQHGIFNFNKIEYFQFSSTKQRRIFFRPFHSFLCSAMQFCSGIFHAFKHNICTLSDIFSFFSSKIFHAIKTSFRTISNFNVIGDKKVVNRTTASLMELRNSLNGCTIDIILNNRTWKIDSLSNFNQPNGFEMISDSCLTAIISFCNSFNRHSIVIHLDNVVQIDSRNFVGHVYNLETQNNIYVANNIITHNCKCFYTIYIE